MPDPDAPSAPSAPSAPGTGVGDGAHVGHDAADGDDLTTLDPLPRTGTSAPAARQPYATSREPVATRIGPPTPVDRGPYGGVTPADDANSHTTGPHDDRHPTGPRDDRDPTPDPDRYGPGEDGGPTASEQPPPDGRWSGGSRAPDPAGAARSARAGRSAQAGRYRPGEPIHRPASAGTSPDPDPAATTGRGAGPVGPELAAAAHRASRGALLLAFAGVVLTIVFFPVGAALDIGAIVLGVRARRLARRAHTSGTPGGLAIGLGIPAVLLSLVFAVLTAVFWTEGRAYVSCTSTAITTTTKDQCTAALRTDLQRRVDSWNR